MNQLVIFQNTFSCRLNTLLVISMSENFEDEKISKYCLVQMGNNQHNPVTMFLSINSNQTACMSLHVKGFISMVSSVQYLAVLC